MATLEGHIVPLRCFSAVPARVFPPRPESTPGFIFFSPAVNPNPGVQIDVSSATLVARVADTYRPPEQKNAVRPFILGPAPAAPSGRAWPPDFSASYKPVLNDAGYGLMNNRPDSKPGFAIRGELINTTTMEVTVVLV